MTESRKHEQSRAIAMPKHLAWVWDVRIVSGDEVIENLRKHAWKRQISVRGDPLDLNLSPRH